LPSENRKASCTAGASSALHDDEIEITSQELQKILLAALECLSSGKINKTTADRITDSAKLAISAMR
jgi:hypothetical protein